MLRSASSFVIAAYAKVRLTPQDELRFAPLILRIRAPCLRPFYEAVPFSRPFKTFYEVVIFAQVQ
jgi:hypothetical protein